MNIDYKRKELTRMKGKERLGYLEGGISIVLNIILFALKYWAGIVSGSIALIADAWHTLSDSLSSVFVIVGVKLSMKKADKKHAFGHGRWEQIVAIFIGFLLTVVAYEFFKESVEKILTGGQVQFGLVAIIVTVASVVVKEGLARFAFRIGRITGNTAVKADGWHHRADALSSIIILIGILLKNYLRWVDSILGIIISLMIAYAAYGIVKEAIDKLLGEGPSEDLIRDVKKIVTGSTGNELFPHHFHIHNYGWHRELTFHVKLEDSTDIKTGHEIVTGIENRIKTELGVETTIHIEPLSVDNGD